MSFRDLTPAEQAHLDDLVAAAGRNPAAAQQLAADAGRLLTATEQRWKDYKDRGFFKRCWYRISGKTSELAAANQADLTSMQAHAWHYLRMLQEQNLVQADAIAVIRGNLHQLAAAEIETREALLNLIDKVEGRLRKVEMKAACAEWLGTRRAEHYERLPACSRVLRIAFDYLALLRREGMRYEDVHKAAHLESALIEAGVPRDETLTLAEFAARLVGELEAGAFERFEQMIALEVEGRPVDGDYILENVSGVGYNAIYEIAGAWRARESVLRQVVDPAQRSEYRRNAVLSGLGGGTAVYSLAELAHEIVAGSLLAEQIFREQHFPPEPALPQVDAAPDGAGFSIDALLGSHFHVEGHAFARLDASPPDRAKYLDAFALVLASTGNFTTDQRSYLSAVERALDDANGLARVDALRVEPRRIPVKDVLAALSGPGRAHTWLLDAAFLASLDAPNLGKALAAIEKVGGALNMKQADVTDFLGQARKLAESTQPAELVRAIAAVRKQTDQWKTIVDFRRISLEGAFADLRKRLWPDFATSFGIVADIGTQQVKLIDCMSFGDENFIQRGALALFRSSRLSELQALRKRAETHVASLDAPLREARSALHSLGYKTPERARLLRDLEIDENTSLDNEAWVDNMQKAFEFLADCVTAHGDYVEGHTRLLEQVEAGKWA